MDIEKHNVNRKIIETIVRVCFTGIALSHIPLASALNVALKPNSN